jgi:four helix bundle protein
MADYLDVENLDVYGKLCDLHLEVCRLSMSWPRAERFELTSQARRNSNSAPANLAEKNSDRHLRNKIEGVNRARGEVEETIHHLRIAFMKKYVRSDEFEDLRARYQECVRMLNGLERSLERHLPARERRFPEKLPPDAHPALGTETCS